jgi:ABC-type uncharacterized transport system permease subunit
MVELLLSLLVASLYIAVAEHYWRRNAQMPLANFLLPAALVLHGWLLYQSLFLENGLNLGLTNALSAIFWLTALIYQLASLKLKLHSLQAFVLPPTAIFLLLQGFRPETHVLSYAGEPLFKWHLAIAFIAYSLLTFAALHALLMMLAERALHRRMSRLPNFPPLIPMEMLLFQVITLGFVLLTLTLISGIAFSEQLFQKAFVFNHKTVFAILSWVIFAALLAGRHFQGWRGRTAIRWTLSGFCVLLLAYVGSKFVLEILLGR